ncbi:hypothetical protein P74p72 [Thermus phage P74-26]|uniref:Uncharacterized protein n=1 Tax=Thermus phage P74-26 TaxID=2914007 RepID=A7XXP7_BP742|nr:hypothetical protein P74p72 [Thermus phage P74-26]ABU97022.1 hypothetical protein P74p72 [Thermus phage P74-26]
MRNADVQLNVGKDHVSAEITRGVVRESLTIWDTGSLYYAYAIDAPPTRLVYAWYFDGENLRPEGDTPDWGLPPYWLEQALR